MQNRSPPSGFLANTTSVANGGDDWQINPFDIFSSSHAFRTTNSVLDMLCRSSHIGVSPSFKLTSWSMLDKWGGSPSGNNSLNSGRNSGYCSGTISSRGCSFNTLASIALLILYNDALNTDNRSSLTVQKNQVPFNVTIFPRNSLCGRISGSNISLAKYTGSGDSSVTPCTVTGASWQCVVQYCDPNITVFDANRTAMSCYHT